MKRILYLSSCLGLNKPDRKYYDNTSMTGIDPNNASSYNNDFPNLNIGGVDTNSNSVPSAQGEATSLNTGPNAAYDKLYSYATGQPTPLDTYNTLQDKAGIPALKNTQMTLSNQVNSLEDTINNTENNVNATTGNSMVTEGQRQNMINSQQHPLLLELDPLARSLGQVSSNLNTEESNVGTEAGLVLQGQQNMQGVLGTGITVAQDNAARQMSGFTADQQMQYQTLMAKIARGEALSDQERSYAQQLQLQKNTYDNGINTLKQQQKYQGVVPGGAIYNSGTNQFASPWSGGSMTGITP